MAWLKDLRFDPIKPLLNSGHPAIEFWTKQDLQRKNVGAAQKVLWDLPIARRIIAHQTDGGFWQYPGNHPRSKMDYNLLETYRQLGFLIEMFGFNRQHPVIQKAAEYVFSKQTAEGDFRGIYGNQYSPNYTAGLLELLLKAGYQDDTRVAQTFAWLENIQQDGGGWAIAVRTQGKNLAALEQSATVDFDRSKPFSHVITGVVLRAYAAHATLRRSATAKTASELLASRFFKKDVYPDRNRVADWTGFSYPFWYTDIVSALDSISLINPTIDSPGVAQAKKWLIEHQQPSGLFGGHLLKDRYHDLQLWHSLAVGRVFGRM